MKSLVVCENGCSHTNTGKTEVFFLPKEGEDGWELAPVVNHQKKGYRSQRCTFQGVPVGSEVVAVLGHEWWGAKGDQSLDRLVFRDKDMPLPPLVKEACLEALEASGNSRDFVANNCIALKYEGEPLFHRLSAERKEKRLLQLGFAPKFAAGAVKERIEILDISEAEFFALEMEEASASSSMSHIRRSWEFFSLRDGRLSDIACELPSSHWSPRGSSFTEGEKKPHARLLLEARKAGGRLVAVHNGAFGHHYSGGYKVYVMR